MAPEFKGARAHIRENPQLALTDFGVEEMQAAYQLEKLSFEVSRSSATLRILGKGATLVVDESDPYFYDNRSAELNRLVTSYDRRERDPYVTATGTVFAGLSGADPKGIIFLPFYNVAAVSASLFSKWFALFGLKLAMSNRLKTNFLWMPFNL